MRRSRALFLTAAAALSGCGGVQTGTSPTGAPAIRDSSPLSTTSGDLLYFGHAVREDTTFRYLLSVVTFPGGKPVATVRLKGPTVGACSDASGNVWVVVQKGREFNAYEYEHGGTAPIAKIHVEHPEDFVTDCAIDPSTGNLAVLVGGPSAKGYAEVWAGARPGEPARYAIPFTPTACAYDADGDLFVDGWIGSTVLFNLAELTKGSSTFEPVALDKEPQNYPGAVRWDGTYLDIADSKIYRVSISGYRGHVAQIVTFDKLSYVADFDVSGAELAGTAGNNGDVIGLWPFPAGGRISKKLAHLPYRSRGIAISAGSGG
jgi:hypothetical protein